MYRRNFFQYSALGSISFLVHLDLFNRKQTKAFLVANSLKKQTYDWIFLYWMPYDNNLSRFGVPILEMLAKGIQNDNILVVVQSKFSGEKQLVRNIITPGKIERQELEAYNSASEKVFSEYLRWAKSQFYEPSHWERK